MCLVSIGRGCKDDGAEEEGDMIVPVRPLSRGAVSGTRANTTTTSGRAPGTTSSAPNGSVSMSVSGNPVTASAPRAEKKNSARSPKLQPTTSHMENAGSSPPSPVVIRQNPSASAAAGGRSAGGSSSDDEAVDEDDDDKDESKAPVETTKAKTRRTMSSTTSSSYGVVLARRGSPRQRQRKSSIVIQTPRESLHTLTPATTLRNDGGGGGGKYDEESREEVALTDDDDEPWMGTTNPRMSATSHQSIGRRSTRESLTVHDENGEKRKMYRRQLNTVKVA